MSTNVVTKIYELLNGGIDAGHYLPPYIENALSLIMSHNIKDKGLLEEILEIIKNTEVTGDDDFIVMKKAIEAASVVGLIIPLKEKVLECIETLLHKLSEKKDSLLVEFARYLARAEQIDEALSISGEIKSKQHYVRARSIVAFEARTDKEKATQILEQAYAIARQTNDTYLYLVMIPAAVFLCDRPEIDELQKKITSVDNNQLMSAIKDSDALLGLLFLSDKLRSKQVLQNALITYSMEVDTLVDVVSILVYHKLDAIYTFLIDTIKEINSKRVQIIMLASIGNKLSEFGAIDRAKEVIDDALQIIALVENESPHEADEMYFYVLYSIENMSYEERYSYIFHASKGISKWRAFTRLVALYVEENKREELAKILQTEYTGDSTEIHIQVLCSKIDGYLYLGEKQLAWQAYQKITKLIQEAESDFVNLYAAVLLEEINEKMRNNGIEIQEGFLQQPDNDNLIE